MKMLDFVLHLLTQILVQGAERFIHEHQVGLEHQRPSNRHPLLLTPRQLSRSSIAEFLQPNHVERALNSASTSTCDLPNLQGKRQVLIHRHVREQSIVLKYMPILRRCGATLFIGLSFK